MSCTIRAFRCFGVALASIAFGSIACAQQISVVPLSTVAANANYAVSPQSNGVTFIGDAEDENNFLIVIDGGVASASLLTLSPEGAILQPGSVGPFALATPIIKLRDDEYSVSFVAIPSALKGTEAESASSQRHRNSGLPTMLRGRLGDLAGDGRTRLVNGLLSMLSFQCLALRIWPEPPIQSL